MTDDIENIRDGIDAIDDEILRLLAERRAFSVRAARLKDVTGAAPRDQLREEDLIAERVAAGLDHALDAGVVNSLWRQIIDDSVRLQRDTVGRDHLVPGALQIAIQGIEGSYSQLATRQFLDGRGEFEISYVRAATFADAFLTEQRRPWRVDTHQERDNSKQRQ